MASTYTPKLGLAKPAHGDVDWHIPINGNWDKIDTELDNINTNLNKALKISGTTIDANKNWNGKNITNVGQLQANSVTTTTVTLIPEPCIWYQDNVTKVATSESYTVLKTANPVPAGVSGTVAVHYDIDARSGNNDVFAQLRKNGSVVRSQTLSHGEYWEGFDYVAVTPGDIISIAFSTRSGGRAKSNKFEIRAIPMPGPVSIAPW